MSQKVHENGKQDGNAQNIPCQATEDLHGKDSPSKNEHRMNESERLPVLETGFQVVRVQPKCFQ